LRQIAMHHLGLPKSNGSTRIGELKFFLNLLFNSFFSKNLYTNFRKIFQYIFLKI
jgi:hypothetical protein